MIVDDQGRYFQPVVSTLAKGAAVGWRVVVSGRYVWAPTLQRYTIVPVSIRATRMATASVKVARLDFTISDTGTPATMSLEAGTWPADPYGDVNLATVNVTPSVVQSVQSHQPGPAAFTITFPKGTPTVIGVRGASNYPLIKACKRS
jgi:hypothetical protein